MRPRTPAVVQHLFEGTARVLQGIAEDRHEAEVLPLPHGAGQSRDDAAPPGEPGRVGQHPTPRHSFTIREKPAHARQYRQDVENLEYLLHVGLDLAQYDPATTTMGSSAEFQ